MCHWINLSVGLYAAGTPLCISQKFESRTSGCLVPITTRSCYHCPPGLTALVGENDAGKTAVIDALRLVVGTRDQDVLRVDPLDFHRPTPEGPSADEIIIRLTFRGLTTADRGAFAEFLTYETVAGATNTVLIVTWVAKRNTKEGSSRRVLPPEWRTGAKGDGPLLDLGARSLLTATYLRPLRDAERAMSSGRGSRLSQILQHTTEIRDTGNPFDKLA